MSTAIAIVTADEQSAKGTGWLALKMELLLTPIFMATLAILLAAVWIYSDFDATTERILQPADLMRQLRQQIEVAVWSTLLVVAVAVPLGVFVTRRGASRAKNSLVGILGLGQAVPAYGLIVLFFVWLGQGTITVVLALASFALLPVLRNTIVGLEQVDTSVIEAGKGMGMTGLQRLSSIEIPLALPVIVAGVRTAAVINVGMASLAFLIGGGGLGETINAGLKLNRPTAIFVGAALVAIVALSLDFLGALAQRYFRPRGV
jgi:osmoprotectant transport system permease protein